MFADAEMSEVFDVLPEDIPPAVDQALREVGAKSIRWSRRGAKASMRWSFWSYGENITVEVSPSGEVWVRSECASPLQLIDWGKNRRNCKAILNAVGRRLGVR
jgi:hypothetical protein